MHARRLAWTLTAICCFANLAAASITVPGADGSDGAFNPVASVQVDLSLAPDGTWDGPNASPGAGVYDPEKWAVVYRYSSVNIPSNVTVTFKNHPSGAPVVWLVSGNVMIAGTVNLNGGNGHAYNAPPTEAEPGPGGFRGGRGSTGNTTIDIAGGSGGYGPGGAGFIGFATPTTNFWGSGGSHATLGGAHPGSELGPAYNNIEVLPLIGGSGGAAGIRFGDTLYSAPGGGAGGGAILIASTADITVTGSITANGGFDGGFASPRSGGGSGGAIRIVADRLLGASATANVSALGRVAHGSAGGIGRIRIETNTLNYAGGINGDYNSAVVGPTATIFPDSSAPKLAITLLDSQAVPADPRRGIMPDVSLSNPFPVTVRVEGVNVPLDWIVEVRAVPRTGATVVEEATFVSGDLSASVWEAQVQFLHGHAAIQARAFPPAP